MFSKTNSTNEKIEYIRSKIPFFSIELKDDYLHFYYDGTHILTNPNNKVLNSMFKQYRYDDYAQTFLAVKEKVEFLKSNSVNIEFLYDTNDILLEFIEDESYD